MKLTDVCLVVDDVDAVFAFYRDVVGLQPRMCNENFADFVLLDGARLAMWQREQVAETVGDGRLSDRSGRFSLSFVAGPDTDFDQLGVRLGEHVIHPPAVSEGDRSLRFSGPDGATVRVVRSSPDVATENTAIVSIEEIELGVIDVDRASSFYVELGFVERNRTAGSSRLEGDGTALVLTPASRNSGRLRSVVSGRRPRCGLLCAIELSSSEEVDTMYDRLRVGGVDLSGPPQQWPWGAWATYFSDPDDNLWEIYAWVAEPYTW